MLSHVPNLFYSFGYPNASWTLRSDLVARFACRLITHMQDKQVSCCEAVPGQDVVADSDGVMGLTSGYLQRAVAGLPRKGSRAPWEPKHDYFNDLEVLDRANFDDPELSFSGIMK
mmetsp:Transcript_32346/g.65936  ORF Transcript_32346/g.65936 Transcript_32346/m.65936 type:complete len:115 (-) Transcript_32346:90-434(-)